jgi:hypothetical protein
MSKKIQDWCVGYENYGIDKVKELVAPPIRIWEISLPLEE